MSPPDTRRERPGRRDGDERYDPLANEAEIVLLAEDLLGEAERAGAAGAEVFAARTQAIHVRYQKGDFELTQVDERTELGLTVVHEHKTGFASTNRSTANELRRTAEAATELARLTLADPHADLVEPGPPPARMRLVHPELASWTLEQCVARAKELVERTLAIDRRLSLDRASLDLTRVDGRARARRHACSSDVGSPATSSAWRSTAPTSGASTRARAGAILVLGRQAGACAKRFAEIALGNLRTGSAESYRGPVLFSPQAFLAVFVAPLVSAASALAVQRGRSALAGKLGMQIASSELTVADDPLDPELHGARVRSRDADASSRARASSRASSATAARRRARASTGHASGGHSLPGLGAHALTVSGGSGGTPDALMERMGRGLYVQRFSGSVDPASGDFSGVAKAARWIEHGAPARSVKETLVSGNAFALLAGHAHLSSTVERVMGSARVPWALIDGLSVTAG